MLLQRPGLLYFSCATLHEAALPLLEQKALGGERTRRIQSRTPNIHRPELDLEELL